LIRSFQKGSLIRSAQQVLLQIGSYQKYMVNKKRLVDYPNLWNYAKDLYSNPAFGGTTDFDAIRKRYYFVDHTPFEDLPRIIPKGPDLSVWNEPNDRAEKFGK
jgi:putative glutathione S-transferase